MTTLLTALMTNGQELGAYYYTDPVLRVDFTCASKGKNTGKKYGTIFNIVKVF